MKASYHSVLIYSMVDICARNYASICLLIFCYIVSAILNAILYGQFAVLTEELNRDANSLLEKVNNVNSVLATSDVTMILKTEIRQHILSTHSLKGS